MLNSYSIAKSLYNENVRDQVIEIFGIYYEIVHKTMVNLYIKNKLRN